MKVPVGAASIGSYQGFDFYFDYVEHAKYSARSIGYVYAKWLRTGEVAFVQASAVRHDLVEGLEGEEVARRLATDAIRRTRSRIDDRSFAIGEVYTIELDELSVENLRARGEKTSAGDSRIAVGQSIRISDEVAGFVRPAPRIVELGLSCFWTSARTAGSGLVVVSFRPVRRIGRA